MLGRLILQSLRGGIEQPSLVLQIRQDDPVSAADEFRSFTIGVSDVVNELHRHARHAIVIFSEEAACYYGLDSQIGIAAEGCDCFLNDLLGLVISLRIGGFRLGIHHSGGHKDYE
jgi:hypothetical protein